MDLLDYFGVEDSKPTTSKTYTTISERYTPTQANEFLGNYKQINN